MQVSYDVEKKCEVPSIRSSCRRRSPSTKSNSYSSTFSVFSFYHAFSVFSVSHAFRMRPHADLPLEADLVSNETYSQLSDCKLSFSCNTDSSDDGESYNQGVGLSDKDDHVDDDQGSSSSQPVHMPFDPVRVRQLTFKTVDEAEDFYIAYGREAGFDVRKNTLQKSDDGLIKNRAWVCSCEGLRKRSNEVHCQKREAKPQTRCGCRASFRVAYDHILGLYKVTRFIHEHNHPLETKETAHRLRCNRYLTPSDKSMLSIMTSVGIKPSQVMDYLEQLHGGAGNLGFTRKDGYNYLYKEKEEMIRGGDAHCALILLEMLKMNDKNMTIKYTVDDEGALTKLFWCDGMSKAEFDLFGDVLVFDSTYKTNRYCFPLVIFSGVNNHRSTCIFGAAILYNENIESYRWLLRNFREAMDGKIPIVVMTDQDAAMKVAIRHEFPGARHRLCCWHLARNARTNLENPDIATQFVRLMMKRCSMDEFEQGWLKFIEDNAIDGHPWIAEIYEKRIMWAEAFLKGYFSAMVRSIQRAESVNALIKLSLRKSFSITEFLKHYHRTLQKIRAHFCKMQEDVEVFKPVAREGPLHNLEKHAANICTKNIFRRVRNEIMAEQGVVVKSFFKTSNRKQEFTFVGYKKCDCRVIVVSIDLDASKFKCSCRKLESDGIPCCHIISGLKNMRVDKFPPNSIHPRWLVEAGKKLKDRFPALLHTIDPQRLRFAKMNKECVNLCFFSSQTDTAFAKSVERIKKAANEAEEEFNMQSSINEGACSKIKCEFDDGSIGLDQLDAEFTNKHEIRDPKRINPRGGKRKKQQNCGVCRQTGHKSSTCAKKPGRKVTKNKNNNQGKGTSATKHGDDNNSPDENDDGCKRHAAIPTHQPQQSLSTQPFYHPPSQYLTHYHVMAPYPHTVPSQFCTNLPQGHQTMAVSSGSTSYVYPLSFPNRGPVPQVPLLYYPAPPPLYPHSTN